MPEDSFKITSDLYRFANQPLENLTRDDGGVTMRRRKCKSNPKREKVIQEIEQEGNQLYILEKPFNTTSVGILIALKMNGYSALYEDDEYVIYSVQMAEEGGIQNITKSTRDRLGEQKSQ